MDKVRCGGHNFFVCLHVVIHDFRNNADHEKQHYMSLLFIVCVFWFFRQYKNSFLGLLNSLSDWIYVRQF